MQTQLEAQASCRCPLPMLQHLLVHQQSFTAYVSQQRLMASPAAKQWQYKHKRPPNFSGPFAITAMSTGAGNASRAVGHARLGGSNGKSLWATADATFAGAALRRQALQSLPLSRIYASSPRANLLWGPRVLQREACCGVPGIPMASLL